MLVRDLIKLLKKMPQDLRVGGAAHDNSDWEIASWAEYVVLFDKADFECPDWVGRTDREWYDAQPDRAVIIRS